MYEFVCDRVIPGCFHKETAQTQKEAREKARQHLKEHHSWESIDDSQQLKIDMAIMGIHR